VSNEGGLKNPGPVRNGVHRDSPGRMCEKTGVALPFESVVDVGT
jgi:hypothetical protein